MSQNPTVLPTVGTITGLQEQGLINDALATLLSNNSGGSAPSSPTHLQFWADTSVSGQATLRVYLAGITTWMPWVTIDTNTGAIIEAPQSPQNWAAAGGTHDAITASYDPPVAALVDGMVLYFRATAANQTSAPTFTPNSGVITAHPITKNGGAPLWGADIPGNNAECAVRYNLANTRWELISPTFDLPVGGIVPYFGGTVPNGFALPQGQNLSSTQFPIASAVLGTTYGNPGGGNFTMPDLRGRFFFNLDAGGSGRITSAGGNFDGTVLGNTGGAQNRTIAQANLPNVNPSIAATFAGTQSNYTVFATGGNPATFTDTASGTGFQIGGAGQWRNLGGFAQGTPVGTVSGTVAINGGVTQQSLATLPPAMGVNCMMRIA